MSANDSDEDGRDVFPTQRVRVSLRADDESSNIVHHFRVGSLSGEKTGKASREGCVKAKDLIESDEWRPPDAI